jgi:autotransporter-associated beta strand protein
VRQTCFFILTLDQNTLKHNQQTPSLIMKISMNNQRTPRQNPARGTLAKPVAALITALFATVLLGGTSVQAVQYWVTNSETDWSSSTNNWFTGSGHSLPNTTDNVRFTNSVACDYGLLPADTYEVSSIALGASNNTIGIINMSGGTLSMTNVPSGGEYGLVMGGSGGSSYTSTTATNSVGTFNMSGGTLNVMRASNGADNNDEVMLGLGTNCTGTFTLNGGTNNFLCAVEIGINGPGILNVNGGFLIDNSWFGVGCGAGTAAGAWGSGTFNLTGGAVYILPNNAASTMTPPSGGLAINQAVTNAVVNISGGTLYSCRIGLDGNTGIPSTGSTDTLNICGGTLYIGYGGVSSNYTTSSPLISQVQSVNISGGTFHTADILPGTALPGTAGYGVFGAITNVLSDGTNWIWAVNPPVNLTNSSFTVNGSTGPGYVTFAPETNRTITLSNVWSGVGGITVTNSTGSGQVIMATNNTYTGDTTVNGGELSLSGGGSIASTNIIVALGATFDVSGLTSTFALASGQTLSNSSSTAILNGSAGSGSGTISLKYAGTPSFTVANGTLTLSPSTTFNVNNTGLALVPGSYLIISTNGAAASVAGTAPSVTVSGVTAGATSSLSISNSELFLVVSASAPVVSPIINGSSVKVNGSGNPTFSGTGASDLTVYGVESTTSLSTKPVVWIEATNVVATPGVPGVTTGSDGSWSFTDANQTNPPTIFYRLYNPDTPGSPPQGHYNYDYDGSIITGTTGDGVYMGDGGSVNNLTNGIITGGWNGVEIDGAIGSVVNAGSITGTTGIGVYLSDGGSVDNLTSGIITGGSYGVQITNAGSIIGTNGYGVYLGDGGSVDNLTNGIINQH